MRSEQNGLQFIDIFNCIFLKGNVRPLIHILLNIALSGPVDSMQYIPTIIWLRQFHSSNPAWYG